MIYFGGVAWMCGSICPGMPQHSKLTGKVLPAGGRRNRARFRPGWDWSGLFCVLHSGRPSRMRNGDNALRAGLVVPRPTAPPTIGFTNRRIGPRSTRRVPRPEHFPD